MFWISCQKEYTGAIVKKATWSLKKTFFLWNIDFTQIFSEDCINGCGQERGLRLES